MDITSVPFQTLVSLLDQLGESTEDSYIIYNPGEKQFYFSKNIIYLYNDFPDNVFKCSEEVWRSIVYPLDLPKVIAVTQELINRSITSYNFNYRIKDPNGKIIWINSRGRAYFDSCSNIMYILGRVSRQVIFDSDREVHRPVITKELNRIYTAGQEGFLLLIGIDGLRRINLKQGREFGDAVIRTLAEYMQISAGEQLVFRVNGDCFCVVLDNADEKQVKDFFKQIQDKMGEQCTLSAGSVSLQTYHVPDGSVLLQYAESALESAKLSGKARISFFSPADYERKLVKMELQEDLETAVNEGYKGFSLAYQAQVRSESFELFGAEVLLRFHSPRRGDVSPQEFIPILETSRLIYPVGLWVMRKALEQCGIWRKKIPDFHISINMSYIQLQYGKIQGDILKILKETGIPGDALTIEVTESMELQDYTHLNVIFGAWKKVGIDIAVDDFGAGYSSLGWLKELAVDEIKIDRCFVHDIQHSAYNLRLLSNMIELADSCHMRVCCEGVESAGELEVLEKLHPSTYQGFFFSKPVSSEQFSVTHLCSRSQFPVINNAVISFSGDTVRPSIRPFQDIQELEHKIFDITEDVVSVCDMDTYEIYYLNLSGQRAFGVRDYWGRKCYKTFWGNDSPCEFCSQNMLRQDTFYVWEAWNNYCDRHFLLKDKLMYLNGIKMRLQIGMDITKHEYISQNARERVEFSKKIVGYVENLRNQRNYSHAVDQLLASIGDFYKADRAYLFERDAVRKEQWNNTYEWCAANVMPQKENLQAIPKEAIERWIDLFEKNQSVIIYNLESVKKSSPLEYEILHMQGIQRLIAVSISWKNRIVAFIGVDNPRYSIQDDSQIRILAAFLSEMFHYSE